VPHGSAAPSAGRSAAAPARTRPGAPTYARPVEVDLVTLVVDDQDAAIAFFVGTLGFDLVADTAATTNDGRPKRWVEVRPPGTATGLLLARADGDAQAAVVGRQAAGRVAFFLHVDDVDAAHDRLTRAGVEFTRPPRTEPYGRVAVFRDVAGNLWDLRGPGAEPR
jgi:catechol 2,3-dioxygenase-like lactoylglutathione lyase family enzyme